MENFDPEGCCEFQVNKGRAFIIDQYWKIFGTPLLLLLLIGIIRSELFLLLTTSAIFGFAYVCDIQNGRSAKKMVIDFRSKTATFHMHRSEIQVHVTFEHIYKIYYNNYLLFYTIQGKIFFKDTSDKNSVVCASYIRALQWGIFSFLGNISKREVESISGRQSRI